MKFAIASHNNGAGARALADALGCRILSNSSQQRIPSSITHVINLGCGNDSPVWNRQMFGITARYNQPQAITFASSKRSTFELFEHYLDNSRGAEQFYPNFYTSAVEANFAVLVEGKSVVARTLDRASSGRGIVLLTPNDVRQQGGIPNASVYTEAIDKGREYRVHIGASRSGASGVVIDVTRKIRRPDAEGERGFIWNHDNDFIFVRDGVNPDTIPTRLIQTASRALFACGLDFGAVDIVVPRRGSNSAQNMPCYALEVNTAPGMEGTTVARYAEYFRYRAGLIDTLTPWRNTTILGDNAPDETYSLGV